MASGDGTGPMGMGRMTGRAGGYCAGFGVPGYANPGRGGGRGMGRSFGGYMTAWTITQTNRFAAASMGSGVTNLFSFAGNCCFIYWGTDQFRNHCWEDPSFYLERSPIMHVDKVSTPLLIQHGLNDPVCPFLQSVEFHNALTRLNKPVEFIGYPRNGHYVSEPKLRLDCIQRNFDWFVEHVKNKK